MSPPANMAHEPTPGPWSLDGHLRPWVCTVGNNPDDPAVFGAPVASDGSYVFGDKVADARLIAAAPELLAHLEYAVKLLAPIAGQAAQVETMRTVIAKATGAQS